MKASNGPTTTELAMGQLRASIFDIVGANRKKLDQDLTIKRLMDMGVDKGRAKEVIHEMTFDRASFIQQIACKMAVKGDNNGR